MRQGLPWPWRPPRCPPRARRCGLGRSSASVEHLRRHAPGRGAGTVVLRARAGALQAEARYAIGPPAAGVTLALEPAEPVKGRDKEAVLTVRLLRPDGTPDDSGAPPVVRVNVGPRGGAGSHRARDVPGPVRVAHDELSGGSHPRGALRVAASAVHLRRVRQDPRPAGGGGGSAGRDGAATRRSPSPSPGRRMAQRSPAGMAASTCRWSCRPEIPSGRGGWWTRAGNVERKPINLGLPPTDGLACVLNPSRLPADGVSHARLLCAASDPLGPARAGCPRHREGELRHIDVGLSAPRPGCSSGSTRRLALSPPSPSASWRRGLRVARTPGRICRCNSSRGRRTSSY